MPPLPRRAVISSEPSRVPTSTDTEISLEMQITSRDYAEKRQRKQIQLTRQLKFMGQNGFHAIVMLVPVHMRGNRETVDWRLSRAGFICMGVPTTDYLSKW